MINLKDNNIIKFQTKYLDITLDKLTEKITSYANISTKRNVFNNEFVYELLSDDGGEHSEFIEDLLIKRLDYIRNKYTEVDNYYKTAMLVFLSKFKVDNEVQKNQDMITLQEKRMKVRKDYVDKFNNPWISDLLDKHTDYTKNQKKFDEMIKEIQTKLVDLNNEISKVFSYEMIIKERHKILFNFGLSVCPYCNRNFISNYEIETTKSKKETIKKTTGDLDHFLPQSYFALFSLSLYNFVPSCQICNSRFKAATMKEIINPYTEVIDYSKLRFTYTLNGTSSIESFLNPDENSFDLFIESNDERYTSHVDLFKLNEIYQIHKPLVGEIIFKQNAHNSSYVSMINQFFSKSPITSSQIEKLLYGIELNEEKFHERPLSKLIYDIVKSYKPIV